MLTSTNGRGDPIRLEADDAAADLQAVADRLADRIETGHSDARLLALIHNHGLQEG